MRWGIRTHHRLAGASPSKPLTLSAAAAVPTSKPVEVATAAAAAPAGCRYTGKCGITRCLVFVNCGTCNYSSRLLPLARHPQELQQRRHIFNLPAVLVGLGEQPQLLQHAESRVSVHRKEEYWDVVRDVAKYKDFIPWCSVRQT